MKRSRILAVMLSLIAMFLFTGCGGSAAKDEVTVLRIANPQATGDNVTLGYELLQELVKEKSNGTMEIELYSNAMLGSDRATTESVQGGTLDMASCSSPNFAGFIPEFMAFDLPYITSPEYQSNLYDAIDYGELGEYYREVARSKGFEIIMFTEYGYRNFATAKKPIQTIKDFENIKLRTTDSPVEIATARAIGAIAMPVAWGETYTALSQGAVDGEGNTWSLLYSAKHHEILKYGIDSRHNYSMHILVMNKRTYDALSEEQKSVLQEAALEALQWQREIAFVNEEANKEHMADSGVIFYDLSEEELQEFKDRTKVVHDDLIGTVIPEVAVNYIKETQSEDYKMQNRDNEEGAVREDEN